MPRGHFSDDQQEHLLRHTLEAPFDKANFPRSDHDRTLTPSRPRFDRVQAMYALLLDLETGR